MKKILLIPLCLLLLSACKKDRLKRTYIKFDTEIEEIEIEDAQYVEENHIRETTITNFKKKIDYGKTQLVDTDFEYQIRIKKISVKRTTGSDFCQGETRITDKYNIYSVIEILNNQGRPLKEFDSFTSDSESFKEKNSKNSDEKVCVFDAIGGYPEMLKKHAKNVRKDLKEELIALGETDID